MDSILNKAQKYVLSILNEKLPKGYLYHNYDHTLYLIRRLRELLEKEKISEEESENLELAVWFYNTGFINSFKQHEEESSRIAREFLAESGYSKERIREVTECIMSTSRKQPLLNYLQKLFVDVLYSPLAGKDFEDDSYLLREEVKQLGLKKFSEKEWIEENIRFFNDHQQFYTPHALELWQYQKNRNLLKLTKQHTKLEKEEKAKKEKESDKNWKKQKESQPGRGIDTVFRVSLKNHLELSGIADTKANILLSVNAIIISFVLANLIPKLDNESNAYLMVPTIIFMIFSVISMALSVIATRPNVTSGKFTKEDIAKKKVNLLFFGNFHKMDLDEFEDAMNDLRQDKDYLYNTLTKDLYFLGKVLERKYKILRITYAVFLTGIIVSVCAFIISLKAAQHF